MLQALAFLDGKAIREELLVAYVSSLKPTGGSGTRGHFLRSALDRPESVVTGRGTPPSERRSTANGSLGMSDPLVAALARYVEALHRRYPDGPEQLRHRGLDARSNITRMSDRRSDPAA